MRNGIKWFHLGFQKCRSSLDIQGQIDWEFSAVDGSFSAGKGGGEGVAHGNKGNAVLIHILTDAFLVLKVSQAFHTMPLIVSCVVFCIGLSI